MSRTRGRYISHNATVTNTSLSMANKGVIIHRQMSSHLLFDVVEPDLAPTVLLARHMTRRTYR